jgi:hypothetical protein
MLYRDGFKLKGRFQILKEGKIIYEKDNLIVDSGKNLLFDRLKDNSVDFLDYIAVGTGTTPPSVSDISLETELDRNQATNKTATTSSFIIETDFGPTEAIGTWREAGIFNASVSGTIFNRVAINYIKDASLVTARFTISYV